MVLQVWSDRVSLQPAAMPVELINPLKIDSNENETQHQMDG